MEIEDLWLIKITMPNTSQEEALAESYAKIQNHASYNFVYKGSHLHFFGDNEYDIFSLDDLTFAKFFIEQPEEFDHCSYCQFRGTIYYVQYHKKKLKIYMLNEKDYIWIFHSEHSFEIEMDYVRFASSSSQFTIILLDVTGGMSYFYLYDINSKNFTLQRKVEGRYYEHLYILDSIFD